MTTIRCFPSLRAGCVPALCILMAALTPVDAFGQAKVATVDAETLARFDMNKNGRLDPDEDAARLAAESRAARVPTASATSATGETLQLSPFEVKESTTGYLATNTMSGTRLNSNLEDLASSISVVTKQQMADFAMLDINDIFAYEAGTEGVGTYTPFEIDRNGRVADSVMSDRESANRVRGIGAANISRSGFATSGRVPVDPIDIDAVEISRGPNSSIFGLGEGSGTVNMVGASANLNRASTTTQLRFDSTGGWRTSFDRMRSSTSCSLCTLGCV